MAFSRDFDGSNPLSHTGIKQPVYLRFFELCLQAGWDAYALTRKTYQGNGIFAGAWKFTDGKFSVVSEPVKIDLVYDKSAGFKFPPEGDHSLIWVDNRDFKRLCWDKWRCYQEIGEYMPQTELISDSSKVSEVVSRIKTDWVVLKPANGLKGFGIYIGPKAGALNFKLEKKYKHYIAQEFLDTTGGIPGITNGMHDLRLVIVNGKVVWSHVRVPPKGSYKANAAGGGVLTEIDLAQIPESVVNIVEKIAKQFLKQYDNPVYSLDFGLEKGKPYIFEINDQIGFPRWEMHNRDNFLNALIENFKMKLAKR